MAVLESRNEGLWLVKQPAKGVDVLADAAAVKRGRKVGGDANVNRSDGSEAYSEGSRFSDSVDFVDSVVGDGNPVLQATADIVGYVIYIISGQEVVTGGADPFQHVQTPAETGFWMKAWKRVGAAAAALRQEFGDARLTSVRIEGSSANKVVKITPTFTSLLAGKTFDTDPIAVSSPENPFGYTEGKGRFDIDGEIHRAHSSFAIVISDGSSPYFGDDVVPLEVTYQGAQVTLEGVTILVNDQGRERYLEQIYGMPDPPAGTMPLTAIPLLGSYGVDLRRGEVWTVSPSGAPTGGDFTLGVDGEDTGAIPFNAAAAIVQAALEAIPRAKLADPIVTGGPGPGAPYRVAFRRLAPTLTADDAGLTGGAGPAVDVATLGPRRQLKIELPGVKWSPQLAIAGNVEGGPVELALAAESRRVVGQPRYRITTRSGDPAYT